MGKPVTSPFLEVTVEKMKLFYKFCKLARKIEHRDDDWVFTEEPHTTRRKAILQKHPEIKQLMGPDPMLAVLVTLEVILQMALCWLLRDASWPVIWTMAYFVGGSINHSLGAAIHEIGHNLAFGHRYAAWNRYFGIFANLPLGIPMSVTYKKYHTDHHRYLGHESLDVDIPTRLETRMFDHPILRAVWLFIYPALQSVRPYYKSPLPVTTYEVMNAVVQVVFDVAIYYVFGARILVYLLGGTFLGLGFHPLAAHFISEHYLFRDGHQATYSYYGPLNVLLFNVGYHVEHHDFPYIPCTRIAKVREMAPEFYDHLPHHTSWLRVLWDFIFDPDMGPKSRGVGYVTNDRLLDEHADAYLKKIDGHATGQNTNKNHAHSNGVHSNVPNHTHRNGIRSNVPNGTHSNGILPNGLHNREIKTEH